jgi:hypothetical protein
VRGRLFNSNFFGTGFEAVLSILHIVCSSWRWGSFVHSLLDALD